MLRGFSKFFVFVGVILSAVVQADDVVDCTNEDIVTTVFNDALALNFTVGSGTNRIIRIFENVSIDDIISSSNNDFDKNYIDAQLVADESNSTNLVIYATENFQNYAHEQIAVRLTLKIIMKCGAAEDHTLIFFQPILEQNYFAPIFEQQRYDIWLPTPLFAGFDITNLTPIGARDDDLVYNQLKFSSSNAALYGLTVSSRNATLERGKIQFAALLLERAMLAFPGDFMLQLTVTDEGRPPLNATAIVVVHADPENQLPKLPQFERSFYYEKIARDYKMAPLSIALIEDTYSNDVDFFLNGSHAELFRLKNLANIIEIELNEAVSLKDFGASTLLELELQARNLKIVDYGRTAVVLQLPENDANFHFGQSTYEGFVDSIGNLDIEPIVFELEAFTTDINFELSGREAEFFELVQESNIFSLNMLPNWMEWWPGKDLFLALELKATKQQKTATTNILLRLLNNNDNEDVENPDNDANFNGSMYALVIKEIEEEREYENFLSMAYNENCSYHIASVYPNDKDYVYINSVLNTLSIFAIDYEAAVFAAMPKPQIRIELRLNCTVALGGRLRSKRQAPPILDNFKEILATDIPYDGQRTILNLIIKDINDNPPSFVYPAVSPFQLGYPDIRICFELFPANVLQVKAVDRDANLNAELRYTLENPSEDFGIDFVTGVVYPLRGFQTNQESVTLLITATDRAGIWDGLSTTIVVEIRRLTDAYFVLLTYESTELDVQAAILDELSASTGLQLKVVKHAILPSNLPKKPRFAHWPAARDAFGDVVYQQAWIYGFKANEPVLCSELQDKMIEVNDLAATNFIVESFEETGLSSNYYHPGSDNDDDYMSIIYWAVILLLMLVNFAFILWFFCSRRGQRLHCCSKQKPMKAITVSNHAAPCAATKPSNCLPLEVSPAASGGGDGIGIYPVVIPSSMVACDFANKPEVNVLHTNSVVSVVDFQIGDDDDDERIESQPTKCK